MKPSLSTHKAPDRRHDAIRDAPVVGFDTGSSAITYQPQLCLIQIAAEIYIFVIDRCHPSTCNFWQAPTDG
jgi:ribonuclease D